MPFLAPALPALKIAAPYLISGATGLFGAKAAKKQEAKPNLFDQMSQKNLGASSDYFSNVLKNPAEATATTTSDLGKQFQQGVNYNARNVMRSGASAGKIAEAPFQLASQAKGQQILAQMGAAGQLGELGMGAGKLGLGQRGLDIEEKQNNRSFWSDIGSSIGGFLTQPGGLSKDSILSRIIKPGGGFTGSGGWSGE